MSRAHATYIPAEQVENATEWNFSAVDQAALRFAAKLRALMPYVPLGEPL